MALLPTQPNVPKVEFDAQTLIVHGDPKVGKTMLMNGAPDALFISTENRCGHVTAMKVDITTWKEFCQVVEELPKHPCKTVIIDTVSNLWTFVADDYCKLKGTKTLMDDKYKEGYGICETFIHRALLQIMKTKRLVMVCHSEEKPYDVVLPDGKTVVEKQRMSPDAYKRLHAIMQKVCTLELFMRIEGGKRVIHPNPSDKWEAGSSLPVGSLALPDAIVIEENADGYQTLKAAYEAAIKKA